MPKLYGCTQEKITLMQALRVCESILGEAVALLYAPSFCQLARIEANQFWEVDPNQPEQEKPVPTEKLETVFEARIFNPDAELRWLNTRNGRGTAVLLTDQEEQVNGCFSKPMVLDYLEILPQQYLLWGKGLQAALPDGWKRLSEAQIGRLDVPLRTLDGEQQAYLLTQEYLAAGQDQYGNVAVVEERLLQIVNSNHERVRQIKKKASENSSEEAA